MTIIQINIAGETAILKMKTKNPEIYSGNGDGKKNNLSENPYFGIKIKVFDMNYYQRVINYLEKTAIKTETKERDISLGKINYIFDEKGKEIARADSKRCLIELTREVKKEIQNKIEDIISE